MNDLFEGSWVVALDVSHEVLDLIFFRFVDDKFIETLHVDIEFLGEVRMSKKDVVDFDKAVVIITLLLIVFEVLAELLVGLNILGLKLLKPFLSLLHSYLLYAHISDKLNIRSLFYAR